MKDDLQRKQMTKCW